MLGFLKQVDLYFRQNPRMFCYIAIGLVVFFILTIVLSIVCPPAALAVGIGSWSLLSNILPLTGIGLLITFAMFTIATQIPHILSSPVEELTLLSEDIPSAYGTIGNGLPSVKKDKQYSGDVTPVEHHDPIFESNESSDNQTGTGSSRAESKFFQR